MSDASDLRAAHGLESEAFFTARRHTRQERVDDGRARRATIPLAEHARVPHLDERPDPVEILRGQEDVRITEFLPLRYERMSADPFAFLRGAAAVMASDLSRVPSSGINVQLCGDAHLANFGMFASAERATVFDINDFDETLPGPFEWDVKRLAASFAVAALQNGLRKKEARAIAKTAVDSYVQTMADLSRMRTMDVWNARLDVDALMTRLTKTTLKKATIKASKKSQRSTTDTALLKLTEIKGGQRRFLDQPPILSRIPDDQRDEVIRGFADVYSSYVATLPADRIALLMRYHFVDLAHKIVGVGSVGTRALVLLLESGDGEPLLLQAKQANQSVLEPYLGDSAFDNHGKRVVIGQRVMQTSGDPFLGWAKGGATSQGDYYLRQLKDRKASIEVPLLDAAGLDGYAGVCGAVLARAHARAGDASTITGYVGEGDEFIQAVGEFAMSYAQITAADHARLVADLANRS